MLLGWPAAGGKQRQAPEVGRRRGVDHRIAYVVTDDPDALHARAVAHGAKVIQELHETDYGSRDFAVADPEGNRWSFGTYPGAPR